MYGVGNYEEKSLKINHLDPARLRLTACREPQLSSFVYHRTTITTRCEVGLGLSVSSDRNTEQIEPLGGREQFAR